MEDHDASRARRRSAGLDPRPAAGLLRAGFSDLLLLLGRGSSEVPVDQVLGREFRLQLQALQLQARAQAAEARRSIDIDHFLYPGSESLQAARVLRIERALSHALVDLTDEIDEAWEPALGWAPDALLRLHRQRTMVERLSLELQDQLDLLRRLVKGWGWVGEARGGREGGA